MSEDEWFTRDWPSAMFDALSATPVGKDANRLRRFGCAICRRMDRVLTDYLRDAILLCDSGGAATDRWFRPAARSVQEMLGAGAFTGARYYAAQAVIRLLEDNVGGAMGFSLSAVAAEGRSLEAECAGLLRCVFGNPFRPARTDIPTEWRTETVLDLAREMYGSRDFTAMPVLGDALQDAGCDDEAVLSHCRDERTRGNERTAGTHQAIHDRGCWVIDLVLAKV